MFQYRQVLVRMRAGDTVRQIARSGLMGREQLGQLRTTALAQGSLGAENDLPDDAAIAAALGPALCAATTWWRRPKGKPLLRVVPTEM